MCIRDRVMGVAIPLRILENRNENWKEAIAKKEKRWKKKLDNSTVIANILFLVCVWIHANDVNNFFPTFLLQPNIPHPLKNFWIRACLKKRCMSWIYRRICAEKNVLCQVWLKWAQWFWRRRFLNFVNVFSLFRNYLPLEKGGAPLFEQTWIPFTQGCFMPILVEIGSGSGEEDF